MALAAVLAIVHGGHEYTSATLNARISKTPSKSHIRSDTNGGLRAFPPQTLNLAITVDFVVFEHGQLGLLALVLDLFGGGVNLLLALLGPSAKTENEMKRRLFLDVVIRESTAVLELFAGEDQALLVWWDSFLV